MTTGFITEYFGGQRDLDTLFARGDTGRNTQFVSEFTGTDLGRWFADIDTGAGLGADTGFIALDGRDLRFWFAAAGSVVADWPIGGGFLLFQNGAERFVTDTVTALVGRMSWSVNSNGTDGPAGNPIADRFNACPGIASPNAGLWQDFGGFNRAAFRRLPLNAVLRFEYGTAALGFPVVASMTVAAGSYVSGWLPIISGGTAHCTTISPYVDDSLNVNGFAPPVATWFGSLAISMDVSSSQNWNLRVAAGFACNLANGSFNEHRIYVTRVS
jgi:hypothetical protein